MSCLCDCLLRIYEYGPPTNLRTIEPGTDKISPIPTTVTNYRDIPARCQAQIDAKPKRVGNCEDGDCEDDDCECVQDAVQAAPYPKPSVPRTVSDWLGRSMIKFDYTVKFTTYTGQCDTKSGIPFQPPEDHEERK